MPTVFPKTRGPAIFNLLLCAALFFGYILARALLSPVPYLARSDIYSVLGGLLVYFFVACIFTDSYTCPKQSSTPAASTPTFFTA